ncbi:Nicotinamide-nucleotide amidohydrolase PncC [Candidatus Thermoflexus japonica]|uniref:Nicotinamide-nucleotide amidohydrolase PncC n=1 Tax=Candidatus Thermoflexus japonica TaxID=2035417 RepID=A0A2H5Y8Q1_9CHLR|nr:Nicotinamide-nucleotide amidohydrolase PncC [Candidatus Thermoflexus japonica]
MEHLELDRAARVGMELKKRGWRLAVAESCTGGLLGHRLTSIPGSSTYFLGGVIAYRNEIKVRILNVRQETLARFGAISAEAAREMAEGVRRIFQADLALAITGVAGPDPEEGKPVGEIYIALASPDGLWTRRIIGGSDRQANKALAVEAALELLEATLREGSS